MSIQVFSELIGRTFDTVTGKVDDEEMVFRSAGGRAFRFYHPRDCCEYVRIEDICGDVADLTGSPIVEAEEVSNEDAPVMENSESYTWTFYRFATAKGAVWVRWLGESNGYYGEGVEFEEVGA